MPLHRGRYADWDGCLCVVRTLNSQTGCLGRFSVASTAWEAVVDCGGRCTFPEFDHILGSEWESVNEQNWKGERTRAGVDVARPYFLVA